jgi:hypothetical protein
MNTTLTNSTSDDSTIIECHILCQLVLLCAYMCITGCIFISCTKEKNRTFCNYLCCSFFFWIICFSGGEGCSPEAETAASSSTGTELVEIGIKK